MQKLEELAVQNSTHHSPTTHHNHAGIYLWRQMTGVAPAAAKLGSVCMYAKILSLRCGTTALGEVT